MRVRCWPDVRNEGCECLDLMTFLRRNTRFFQIVQPLSTLVALCNDDHNSRPWIIQWLCAVRSCQIAPLATRALTVFRSKDGNAVVWRRRGRSNLVESLRSLPLLLMYLSEPNAKCNTGFVNVGGQCLPCKFRVFVPQKQGVQIHFSTIPWSKNMHSSSTMHSTRAGHFVRKRILHLPKQQAYHGFG